MPGNARTRATTWTSACEPPSVTVCRPIRRPPRSPAAGHASSRACAPRSERRAGQCASSTRPRLGGSTISASNGWPAAKRARTEDLGDLGNGIRERPRNRDCRVDDTLNVGAVRHERFLVDVRDQRRTEDGRRTQTTRFRPATVTVSAIDEPACRRNTPQRQEHRSRCDRSPDARTSGPKQPPEIPVSGAATRAGRRSTTRRG